MYLSLLFAGAFSISQHLPVRSDTIPNSQTPTFSTEGERQMHELQQLFREHYKPQSYPLFDGGITRVARGVYRFGLFTMRIDSLPGEMTGLLSRGLLYPSLLAPIFGSTDTLSIGNIVEIRELSSSLQKKRFSCLVSSQKMANPVLYVFELTNEHGIPKMDMSTFIRGARLTFLSQVTIII